MSAGSGRALRIAILGAAALALLLWLAIKWPLTGLTVVVGGLVVAAALGGVEFFSGWLRWTRWAVWRTEQGSHLSFDGISLHLDDDNVHLWINAGEWRRLRRIKETDDVTAARHSAGWRRNQGGGLQLRLDVVIAVMAQASDRLEARNIKLRRYLERDILFPAAERRRRRQT